MAVELFLPPNSVSSPWKRKTHNRILFFVPTGIQEENCRTAQHMGLQCRRTTLLSLVSKNIGFSSSSFLISTSDPNTQRKGKRNRKTVKCY
jgi:hypothetical protein